MEIGNLWVRLGLGSDEFRKGIKESERDAQTFGKTLTGVFKTATSSVQASLRSLGQVKLKDVVQMPEFKETIGELRDLQLEYALTSSKMKNTATDTEKLEAQLEYLNSALAAHQKGMDAVRQAYNKAAAEKGKDSAEAKKLETQLKRLELAESNLKNNIHDTETALKKQTEAVNKSEGGFKSLSNQLDKFQNKTNTVSTAIKGLVAGIGIAGGWNWLVSGNAQMEQYRQTLNVVMKDTQKAGEILEWATKFAAQTPFELPEIIEATTRLQAYGIEAQKVLGDIGDMAAAMGKPLTQAMEAVADAQTGELERLKEFGITKQMLIAQAAEMGKGEIVNAQGQITNLQAMNDALIAIIRERYNGAMKAQSTTLNGMISNLKDWLGSAGRILGENIFENVKTQLDELLVSTERLSDSGQLETWGKRIGAVFTGLFNALKWVKNQSDILIPVLGGLTASFVAMKVVSAVTTLMNAYRNSVIVTTIAQQGLNAALRANPIGIVITLIGLLVTAAIALYRAWVSNWGGIQTKTQAVASAIVAVANRMVISIATGFNKLKRAVFSLLEGILNAVAPVVSVIGKIAPGFEAGFDKARSAVSNEIDDIDIKLQELGVSAQEAGEKLSAAISDVSAAFRPGFAEAGSIGDFRKLEAEAGGAVGAVDELSEAMDGFGESADDAGKKGSKAAKDTRAAWEVTLDTLQSKLQAIQAQGEIASISLANASEAEKLTASLSNLNKQYDIQKQIVSGLQTAYTNLVKTKGQNSKETASAASKYAQEARALSDLANKISETQLALAKQTWITAEVKEEIEILNAEHEKEVALLDAEAGKVAELNLKQEQLSESLSAQSSLVKDLTREYEAAKEIKGADAEETRKAYMELIKAQTEEAKLQKEIRNTNKELAEQARELENTAQKAASLAQKYRDDMAEALDNYRQKVADTNAKLAEDEQKLTDQYNQSIASRANALMDWVGLFDAVPKQNNISGQDLLNNLQGQVDAFEEWQKNLQALAARGVDDGLIAELEQMGPKASGEIAALNTLTDDELQQYVLLWQEKSSLATQQATSELEGLRVETQAKIEELRANAAAQLAEYAKEWEQKNREIRENTVKELEKLVEEAQKLGAQFASALTEAIATALPGLAGVFTPPETGQADEAADQRKGVIGEAKTQATQHAAIVQNEVSTLLKSWADASNQLSAKQNEIKTQSITTWQEIQQKLSALWQKINADLTKGWTDNRNFIYDILGQVDARFKATEGAATHWGRNLMSNFISGIESMQGRLADTLLAISMEVESYLGFHSPTKKGPGRKADTWAPNMVQMLSSGIQEELPLLQAASEQLIDSIRAPIVNVAPSPAIAAVDGGTRTIQISVTGYSPREIGEEIYRKLKRMGV